MGQSTLYCRTVYSECWPLMPSEKVCLPGLLICLYHRLRAGGRANVHSTWLIPLSLAHSSVYCSFVELRQTSLIALYLNIWVQEGF